FDKKSGINTHLFSTEIVNREAFFFTPDINFASQYGKKKYEVYLKINKIFNFNKHYFYKDISPETSILFDKIINYIEDNGIEITTEYQSYRGELKIKPEYNWKFFDGEIGRLFVEYLKKKGYDGAHFIEDDSPVYVVFNPNQIKSVDNDGSWDIDDNDIYS
ncbi:MAG: ADP-Ribosyltransferase in polyvalent protein, partial [Bacteroidota bacterium]